MAEQNKERIRIYRREFRIRNKEKLREKDREYRLKNLEKLKAIDAANYLKNRVARLEYSRDRYRTGDAGKLRARAAEYAKRRAATLAAAVSLGLIDPVAERKPPTEWQVKKNARYRELRTDDSYRLKWDAYRKKYQEIHREKINQRAREKTRRDRDALQALRQLALIPNGG